MGIDQVFEDLKPVRIYLYLSRQEVCVNAMASKLELSELEVVEHINTLISTNLIIENVTGKLTHYKVNDRGSEEILKWLKKHKYLTETLKDIEEIDVNCGAGCM